MKSISSEASDFVFSLCTNVLWPSERGELGSSTFWSRAPRDEWVYHCWAAGGTCKSLEDKANYSIIVHCSVRRLANSTPACSLWVRFAHSVQNTFANSARVRFETFVLGGRLPARGHGSLPHVELRFLDGWVSLHHPHHHPHDDDRDQWLSIIVMHISQEGPLG